MNTQDNPLMSALVEIMHEHIEEIAQTIYEWGPASSEIDALLREYLRAAENDALRECVRIAANAALA